MMIGARFGAGIIRLNTAKPLMFFFAGVEFADCCWGARVIARQQRDSLTGNSNTDTSIYIEFALKGLGNIGSDTTTLLQDVVPEYRPIYYEKPQ